MCVTDHHDMTLAVKVAFKFKPKYNQPTNRELHCYHSRIVQQTENSHLVQNHYRMVPLPKLLSTHTNTCITIPINVPNNT